jgi:hypothetical protein
MHLNDSVPSPTLSLRLAGNTGQEIVRQRSGDMVNSDGCVNRLRLSRQPTVGRLKHGGYKPCNSGETKPAGNKFANGNLVGGIKHGRCAIALLKGLSR